MLDERVTRDESDVEGIFARLKAEVRARAPTHSTGGAAFPAWSSLRGEADRLALVSAERPYLYKAGRWGRIRGLLLLPFKAVLRRLMRWYVEPLAVDQRRFNDAVLRLLDELREQTERIRELEERLARLERTDGS